MGAVVDFDDVGAVRDEADWDEVRSKWGDGPYMRAFTVHLPRGIDADACLIALWRVHAAHGDEAVSPDTAILTRLAGSRAALRGECLPWSVWLSGRDFEVLRAYGAVDGDGLAMVLVASVMAAGDARMQARRSARGKRLH